jgi:hypothetical protein
MSWDVTLIRFQNHYEVVADVPEGVEPVPLGSLEAVQTAIEDSFPGVVWQPMRQWGLWGAWSAAEESVEFNLGVDELVAGLGLHVQAEQSVVDSILNLAERLDAQVLDVSVGEFLRPGEPAAGLEAWRSRHEEASQPELPGKREQPGASPTRTTVGATAAATTITIELTSGQAQQLHALAAAYQLRPEQLASAWVVSKMEDVVARMRGAQPS